MVVVGGGIIEKIHREENNFQSSGRDKQVEFSGGINELAAARQRPFDRDSLARSINNLSSGLRRREKQSRG